MKKQYNKPSMEVIQLQQAPTILAGSTYPPGYGGELGAPEFDTVIWDEDDDNLLK